MEGKNALILNCKSSDIGSWGAFSAKLQKNNEYKQLTNWDYTMSIVYIGLSFLMLSVIILLFIDIIRDKLI